MEFMYCIPDLDMFIDRTIKKCLLDYDLNSDDAEYVLNDIEKVMVRPTEEDGGYCQKILKDGNQNTPKTRHDHPLLLDTKRNRDLPSVLGTAHDLQKRNAMHKIQAGKEETLASFVKHEHKMPILPSSALDFSMKSLSPQSAHNFLEDQENSSRSPPPRRDCKSLSPDIRHSPNPASKLKSRLQQRYFQYSRESSPELRNGEEEEEDQEPRNLNSPDSGHATSEGSVCDRGFSPSPPRLTCRKRPSSGDEGDEQVTGEGYTLSNVDTVGSRVQKCLDQEQPSTKISRLIEYTNPNVRRHRLRHPSQKEAGAFLLSRSKSEISVSRIQTPLASSGHSRTECHDTIESVTSPFSTSCQRPRHQPQMEANGNGIPCSKTDTSGSTGHTRVASEQPTTELQRWLEYFTPPNSTSCPKPTQPIHQSQNEAGGNMSPRHKVGASGSIVQKYVVRRNRMPHLIKNLTSPNPTSSQRALHRSQTGESGTLFPQSQIEYSDSHAQGRSASEQSRAKIANLIEHRTTMKSSSMKRPMHPSQMEKYHNVPNLPILHYPPFASCPNRSPPIDTLKTSMQYHVVPNNETDLPSAQIKLGQTELREQHHTATINHHPLSTLTCDGSQATQNHPGHPQQQTNKHHHQGFQVLKQRLQQGNQDQKLGDSYPTSQNQRWQYQLAQRQQYMDRFHQEPATTAEGFSDQTSLISSIIVKELMNVEDDPVPNAIPSVVSREANPNIPSYLRRTSAFDLDASIAENQTMQDAIASSSSTPSSQGGSQLITVTSWHSPPPPPPPSVQNVLETSPQQQLMPLRAHQTPRNVSRVCVVPDSPICLTILPTSSSDEYGQNEPQDLSQKSSRRHDAEI